MKYNSSFSIKDWKEEPLMELPEPKKFNRGQVKRSHKGYIKGDEVMQYTFLYANEGRSEFVGIGLIDGQVGEAEGQFVVLERGSYEGKSVDVEFDVRQLRANGDYGPIIGTGNYQTSEHCDIDYIFTEG